MGSRTPLRRAVTIAVAALVGALALTLIGQALGRPGTVGADLPTTTALPDPGGSPSRSTASARESSARESSAGRVGVRPARLPAARPTVPPTALRIPRLGVTLPIDPAGVAPDGQMALPDSPRRLAWYRFGAAPLSARGATVLGGHVDTLEDGVGPLAQLVSLRPGDRVEVVAGRRTVTYRVSTVARVPKSRLDAAEVFSRTGLPRLHLLTCGGAYLADRGGYQDNVVVVARPIA